MKQYLIDDLRLEDYRKLKDYLQTNYGAPTLGNIFWVELETSILTPLQLEHTACRPHVFALEIEEGFLSCELLVRIKSNIKCDCMGYATAEQREWIITKMDSMLVELEIDI